MTYIHRDANGVAVDLTGYKAAMSIAYQRGGARHSHLTNSANTDGGKISLSQSGEVVFSMTASQTLGIDSVLALFLGPVPKYDDPNRFIYVYDFDLTDPQGVVSRVLTGRMVVNRRAAL